MVRWLRLLGFGGFDCRLRLGLQAIKSCLEQVARHLRMQYPFGMRFVGEYLCYGTSYILGCLRHSVALDGLDLSECLKMPWMESNRCEPFLGGSRKPM